MSDFAWTVIGIGAASIGYLWLMVVEATMKKRKRHEKSNAFVNPYGSLQLGANVIHGVVDDGAGLWFSAEGIYD